MWVSILACALKSVLLFCFVLVGVCSGQLLCWISLSGHYILSVSRGLLSGDDQRLELVFAGIPFDIGGLSLLTIATEN